MPTRGVHLARLLELRERCLELFEVTRQGGVAVRGSMRWESAPKRRGAGGRGSGLDFPARPGGHSASAITASTTFLTGGAFFFQLLMRFGSSSTSNPPRWAP